MHSWIFGVNVCLSLFNVRIPVLFYVKLSLFSHLFLFPPCPPQLELPFGASAGSNLVICLFYSCSLVFVFSFCLNKKAWRFGRFVAQGSLRKAMTPFQKVRASCDLIGHPTSTRLDARNGPLYRIPGALVSNPSVCGNEKNRGLRSGERLTTVCRSRQERTCNAQIEFS